MAERSSIKNFLFEEKDDDDPGGRAFLSAFELRRGDRQWAEASHNIKGCVHINFFPSAPFAPHQQKRKSLRPFLEAVISLPRIL